jgi:hypothetical protein
LLEIASAVWQIGSTWATYSVRVEAPMAVLAVIASAITMIAGAISFIRAPPVLKSETGHKPVPSPAMDCAEPKRLGFDNQPVGASGSGKLFERAQLPAQLVVPLLRGNARFAGHCLVVPDVSDGLETFRLRAWA